MYKRTAQASKPASHRNALRAAELESRVKMHNTIFKGHCMHKYGASDSGIEFQKFQGATGRENRGGNCLF
jgi:hypothetical protein